MNGESTGWLLAMLAYLWCAGCVALGLIGFIRRASIRWVSVLLKTTGPALTLFGLYEGVLTTVIVLRALRP